MTPEQARQEAWESWLEDNRDCFPADKLLVIRAIYFDGYEDGKRRAENTEMMARLEQIEMQL